MLIFPIARWLETRQICLLGHPFLLNEHLILNTLILATNVYFVLVLSTSICWYLVFMMSHLFIVIVFLLMLLKPTNPLAYYLHSSISEIVYSHKKQIKNILNAATKSFSAFQNSCYREKKL